MNVRFFGGRKEEYLSIPKHNPIGLYFCADTRELFLGDRLLSDGMRVVPTFADLPSISEHKAAEGIIYFVEATKNGYVLPRGRSEWLQVIYAPTTGEGADIDLSDYYTKAEVDEAILKAIANIEIEVDLSNYATKEEVAVIQQQSARNEVKILAIDSELFDIKEQIANISTTDLTQYYTKSEVDELIPDVSGFATKEELQEAIDSIEHPIIDLTRYATKEDVTAVEAKIPSTDGFATKQELEEAIGSIEHPTVDLEGYATEEWVNAQGFLKEHQDLSDYAKKSDIPQPELFVVDYNAPDFAAALEAYNNGKLLLLTNAAPDTNGYAVMNYVRNDMITFTKFLMSRSGTYGSFNTYYLHDDNTWELAKEVKLNKVEAVTDADKINGITIGKETYTFDYATTEAVNQINQSIQNIETTYVTNETLEQKNYVTQETADSTYITTEKAAEVIETRVETVIQEKADAGEIAVKVDTVSYDTW